MTRYRYLFLLIISLVANAGYLSAQPRTARPFPQHTAYVKGSIIPRHIARETIDDSVRSFYDQWKKKYVRPACTPGESYIWFQGRDAGKQSVSEGQGYGMLITVMMAGHDPSARQTFDALLRYARSHPSKTSPYLMAWAQKNNCRSTDGTSATDGDLDIAYALLCAYTQWGDDTYRKEALKMIEAIAKQEINRQIYTPLLSNSVEDDSRDYFDMRSSDFMPAHFRAFAAATRDTLWSKAIDNSYRLFTYLQDTYSPEAGLVPDFITKIRFTPSISATPAKPKYLEARSDGMYNFNACRMPWRIGTDYLLNGSANAGALLTKLNRWIRATTKDDPDNISAGYNLAGEDLPKRYFEAMCFIAPFAVSAMTDQHNQVWLDHLWDYMIHFPLKDFDYYDNSIKMIDMIIISGNYWAP